MKLSCAEAAPWTKVRVVCSPINKLQLKFSPRTASFLAHSGFFLFSFLSVHQTQPCPPWEPSIISSFFQRNQGGKGIRLFFLSIFVFVCAHMCGSHGTVLVTSNGAWRQGTFIRGCLPLSVSVPWPWDSLEISLPRTCQDRPCLASGADTYGLAWSVQVNTWIRLLEVLSQPEIHLLNLSTPS